MRASRWPSSRSSGASRQRWWLVGPTYLRSRRDFQQRRTIVFSEQSLASGRCHVLRKVGTRAHARRGGAARWRPARQQQRAMPSLFVLPDDLLADCFKHLPPTALARVSAVNKALRRIANREELWAELCRESFGDTTAGLSVASHRAVYRRRHCRSRWRRRSDRARISLSNLQLVFAWKESWYLPDCPLVTTGRCDCCQSDVVSFSATCRSRLPRS